MNQFERIKNMSIEEMADFIDLCESRGYCDSSIARDKNDKLMDTKDWLESEVTE